MRLEPRAAVGLFVIGAAGGLVGDQAHVAAGVTRYLDHSLPFVWRSEIWFPLAVGLGTVSLAELRLRMAAAGRPAPSATGITAPSVDWGIPAGPRWREAMAAIASVLALYALTAVVVDEAVGPSVTLISALAVLVGVRFAGNWPALACGILAAFVGPVVEIAVVAGGVAEYSENVDGLFGVAPWLPALYFAFGVVVSRLAELASAEPPA